MGKGGVFGSFVMVKLDKGTSKKYTPEGGVKKNIEGTTSPKSPLVYIKSPIAKFFGFQEVTPADIIRLSKRKVKTKINGKEVTVDTIVSSGATGASRSVAVKFTKLISIGGKQVASVKIAMPSSYTFGDMVTLLTEGPKAGDIAAIVSPDGRSVTFKTPYNPKKKAGK